MEDEKNILKDGAENSETPKKGRGAKAADVSGAVEEIKAEANVEPMRKVRVIEDHETHIGGTNIYLSRGEETALPEGIATVLQNAGVVIFK